MQMRPEKKCDFPEAQVLEFLIWNCANPDQ